MLRVFHCTPMYAVACMPLQSEALILRTYPFHEADLLVTFFTRTEGKIRGVAKAAKRSKRRFGGALEPLTHVTAHWEEKEKQELGIMIVN